MDNIIIKILAKVDMISTINFLGNNFIFLDEIDKMISKFWVYG